MTFLENAQPMIIATSSKGQELLRNFAALLKLLWLHYNIAFLENAQPIFDNNDNCYWL